MKALEHDFQNPTLVKEATLTSTGLMEGKCKRCSETTKEVIPCKVEDTTTGITVETNEGVFTEGTTTNFTVITKDDSNYESVKNAVADKGSKFAAYNIQYMLNGAVTSPNGEYTLLLPNEQGISADNMLVLHIAADGTVTEKEFVVENNKIAIKTKESGTYVVVDRNSTEAKEDEQANKTDSVVEEETSIPVIAWIGGVAAILLVGGGAVAVPVIKKRKNK